MNANSRAMVFPHVGTRQSMLLPKAVGFFFSFRLFTVLLSVRFLQLDAQTAAAINIVFNLLLLAAVAFHSMGPAPSTLMSTFRVRPFRWVIAFLSFSFISLFWTAAVSVPAAFAFWCAMAADVLIVVLLLRTGPETEMTTSVMEGYVIGACCVALVAWALPAQADLRLGDEELLGPNQIGYACGLAVFLAQYLMNRGAGNWTLPAAFLAITLLRSLSKTTIVALIAGEVVLLAKDRSIAPKTKLAIAAATLMVVGVFWSLLSAYFEIYSNAGNQAETLTGRLGIWVIFLDKAIEQPWIGHGFHSVWKVIPPFGPDQFEPRHAHNELLQQFYAYGVTGIAIMIALYGSFYRQIRKLSTGPLQSLLFGLFTFGIVRGLADTEAFDLSLPLWAITLIGVTLSRTESPTAVPALLGDHCA
jgi:exopolysaccharide production protein ExoQ